MIALGLGYAGLWLLPPAAHRAEHLQLPLPVSRGHRCDAALRVSRHAFCGAKARRPALREAASKLALGIDSKSLTLGETVSGRIHGVRISIRPAPGAFEWRRRKRSPGGLEIKIELETPLRIASSSHRGASSRPDGAG